MNNFLVEILTQEMPYAFIPSAVEQLHADFEKLLKENSIKFKTTEVYATPRRLAVIITGLDDKQEDIQKDIRGPILNIAKNEHGEFSPAAVGFANKNGVEQDALYEKEGYIWAKIKQKGKSTKEILSENISDIFLNLQGAHFMRWKDFDIKFSRPIENIVALFNEEILPLEIVDKKATNITYGHRYSANKSVKIKKPLTYTEQLKDVNVIVEQDKRRDLIVESATKKAKEIGAEIKFNPDLLEEVTYLTEFPKPVLCNFKEKYLSIPDIVNITVMESHQRYFPLYTHEGKLLNRFITIANFVGDDEKSLKNIQAGNERVISARLEDGVFFYNEDTKEPLANKVEDLKGMTFQRNLGTLYDKTQRIVTLCDMICDELNLQKQDILRCAHLCKADLSTKLVFEFTELQGFIGEDYALKSAEKANVAKGISEHYYPLNANSETAQGLEGQIVGIADKIDTISAVFLSTQGDKKKKRPTGSNYPLGVRRAVLGILRTILDANLKINLSNLIKKSIEILSKSFNVEVSPETMSEIEEFFINRLIIMFEKTYPQNVLYAAAGADSSPLADLNGYFERVKILEDFIKKDGFEKISENANRTIRILPKNAVFKEVDEKLFVTQEEKELYGAAAKTSNSQDFEILSKNIEKFFDKVLVMDKEEKVKENRIALLNFVNNKFRILCDFSKIN